MDMIQSNHLSADPNVSITINWVPLQAFQEEDGSKKVKFYNTKNLM